MPACMQLQSFLKLFRGGAGGGSRRRKIQKACYDARITMLCGMLTFVLLRSCFGAGQFRTPMDDFQDIQRGRRQLYNSLFANNYQMKEIMRNNSIDEITPNKQKMAYIASGAQQLQLNIAESNINYVSKASFIIPPNTNNNSLNTPLGFTNYSTRANYTDLGLNNTATTVLGSSKYTKTRSKITESGSIIKPYADHQLGSSINSNISTPNYIILGSELNSNLSSQEDYKKAAMVLSPRTSLLQANPKRPHILLVTASSLASPCQSNYNSLRSINNKIEYCRLHGIEMLYSMAYNLGSQKSNYWEKLTFFHRAMISNPNAEWIWWVDSDAVFTNMSMELPMEKYAEHNMVFYGWDEQLLEGLIINPIGGSFLIRNCPWSLDLLSQFLGRKLRTEFKLEDDEEEWGMFMGFLIREWGSKVYLESSNNFLYRMWINVLVESDQDSLNQDNYDEIKVWPLISHFVGCKPSCNDHYEANKVCMLLHEMMQRAFNVGDNQLADELIQSLHQHSLDHH